MLARADQAGLMHPARLGGTIAGDPACASQCVQGGECLDKCPQQLQIPTLLEQVADTLEGNDLTQHEDTAKRFFCVD